MGKNNGPFKDYSSTTMETDELSEDNFYSIVDTELIECFATLADHRIILLILLRNMIVT